MSTLRNGVSLGIRVKGRASVVNTLGKWLFQNSDTLQWGLGGGGGRHIEGSVALCSKEKAEYIPEKNIFPVSFHFPSSYCILRCQKECW